MPLRMTDSNTGLMHCSPVTSTRPLVCFISKHTTVSMVNGTSAIRCLDITIHTNTHQGRSKRFEQLRRAITRLLCERRSQSHQPAHLVDAWRRLDGMPVTRSCDTNAAQVSTWSYSIGPTKYPASSTAPPRPATAPFGQTSTWCKTQPPPLWTTRWLANARARRTCATHSSSVRAGFGCDRGAVNQVHQQAPTIMRATTTFHLGLVAKIITTATCSVWLSRSRACSSKTRIVRRSTTWRTNGPCCFGGLVRCHRFCH